MFWIVILLCVCADQLTKALVERSMELGSTRTLVPGVLDLTYTHNTGAAFSILTDRQTFLIVVTALVMTAMVVYVIRKGKAIFLPEKLALALIVGGGCGNLICRIARGYVIDFINIHILPIFNAADICVCCGCALLVLSVLFLEPRHAAAEKDSDERRSDL